MKERQTSVRQARVSIACTRATARSTYRTRAAAQPARTHRQKSMSSMADRPFGWKTHSHHILGMLLVLWMALGSLHCGIQLANAAVFPLQVTAPSNESLVTRGTATQVSWLNVTSGQG